MQAINHISTRSLLLFFVAYTAFLQAGTKNSVSLVDQLPIFTQQDIADFDTMQNAIKLATEAFVADVRNGVIQKAPANDLANLVENRLMAPVDIKQRVFEEVVRILELPVYLRDVQTFKVGLDTISDDLASMKDFPIDWYRSIIYQLYLNAAYMFIVRHTADNLAKDLISQNPYQALLKNIIKPLNELIATWPDQRSAQAFASRLTRDIFAAIAQNSTLNNDQKNMLFNVHNAVYTAENPSYRLSTDDMNYITSLVIP